MSAIVEVGCVPLRMAGVGRGTFCDELVIFLNRKSYIRDLYESERMRLLPTCWYVVLRWFSLLPPLTNLVTQWISKECPVRGASPRQFYFILPTSSLGKQPPTTSIIDRYTSPANSPFSVIYSPGGMPGGKPAAQLSHKPRPNTQSTRTNNAYFTFLTWCY